MITIMTGTPGSGKSLNMAKSIYWRVRFGKPVVANFEVNGDMFRDDSSFVYLPNEELNPDALERIAREYFADHEFGEGKIHLYIDECQLIFNSRTWSKNSEWIRFFSQHRKLGYDVFLVAQYDEMVDKQIRTLIEYQVHHRKVNNVGLFGKLVSLFALGHPVVVAVRTWYGQKLRLDSEWMLGTKKYYRLYDTYKLFG